MDELTKDAYLKALASKANQLQDLVDNILRILEKSPSLGDIQKHHLLAEANAIQDHVKGLRMKITEIS